MQSEWLLNPVSFLKGSAVDPFNSTIRPMSTEANSLLKYYSGFVSSGYITFKLQHLPAKFRNLLSIQAINDDYLSNAVQYEHCLFALYAFSAVRLSHVMKIRLMGLRSPQYYMAQAVTALRHRLDELQQSGSAIDRATIGAIAQLALADWTAGDLTTARIHVNSLVSTLGFVDIEDVRGRFMIETIRTADFQIALEHGSFPLLSAVPSFEPMSRERLKWLGEQVREALTAEKAQSPDIASRLGRETPRPSELLDDLDITLDYRMGWALEEILNTDLIDSGLHPVIQADLEVLTIAKTVWRLGVASVADARYMCRWGRTQLHFLHTYGFEHAADEPTPQASLTNCIRLSLLIIGTLCTNRMSERTTHLIVFELFEACRCFDLSLQMPRLARLAYLWSLVTAATVADETPQTRTWLINRAADTAIQLDLTKYEELDEAMIGFLYSWTFSIQVMRDVLDAIDSRSMVPWDKMMGYGAVKLV